MQQFTLDFVVFRLALSSSILSKLRLLKEPSATGEISAATPLTQTKCRIKIMCLRKDLSLVLNVKILRNFA